MLSVNCGIQKQPSISLPYQFLSFWWFPGDHNVCLYCWGGAGGARTSAVIFVLVKKYSPHQKENHEGISLHCINIHYPPNPLLCHYCGPERAEDGGTNRKADWSKTTKQNKKKSKGRRRKGLDTYTKSLLCRNNLLVFEFPPIVPG